jgi:MFS family permease
MDSATQLVIGKVDAPADGESFQASQSYRYYVAWLLCGVYAVNMMDRQLLSVLLEPIKREFVLSDTAMGLLSGMAFALFYSTLGMPIARHADRGSRSAIIALSILVWSVFTTLTGFARGVVHLLAARVGVAIGEAGCNPAAYSLLGDYFPPERRGTALAIYQMGANIGAFVGLLCGGFIAEAYGWRTAFLVVGIPGVALALLVKLTLREPPRGFSDAAPLVALPPPALQVLRGLWAKRSFRHIAFAAALHNFAIYGVGNFYSSFLIRSHGLGVARTGVILAFIYLIGGLLGTWLGGALSDRYAQHKRDPRYYLWVPGALLLCGLPISQLAYWVDSTVTVIGLMTIAMIAGAGYLAPSIAATYRLVGGRERALASALLLLVLNLVGLGLGPLCSGWLSDALNGYLQRHGSDATSATADGLRYALSIVSLVNLWSAAHYFMAARSLRRDAVLDHPAPLGHIA